MSFEGRDDFEMKMECAKGRSVKQTDETFSHQGVQEFVAHPSEEH
jgi:hypothetical protein